MLVLTREENETIRIGNEIVIHVCQIRGKRVKIGITAPKSIAIVRDNAAKTTKKGGSK